MVFSLDKCMLLALVACMKASTTCPPSLLVMAAGLPPDENAGQQPDAGTRPPGRNNDNDVDDDPLLRHRQGMIQWLRDGGGFISDKVEIRRRVPGDPSSPAGIFATDEILQDEIVFHIPNHLYLKIPHDQVLIFNSDDDESDDDDDEDDDDNDDLLRYKEYILEMEQAEMEVYYVNSCRLVHRLLNETKLYRSSPQSSNYAPYIGYLEETQRLGQLPAAYSPEGKALLRKVQGIENYNYSRDDDDDNSTTLAPRSKYYGRSPLPPHNLVDWIDESFVKRECFDADDIDAYHAAELVIQRGFDLELIPIWDLVNHEVKHRVNVQTNSLRSEEGLVVTAKQIIYKGDEILYTYNYCTDCNNDGFWWGAPGIYRDFGFLEDYPQEWPFQDQEVYAQIWKEHGGSNSEHYYATFYSKAEVAAIEEEAASLLNVTHECAPDQTDLIFFNEQLLRLQSLDIESEADKISSFYERTMIRQYYKALRVAISSVIEAVVNHPQIPRDCSLENICLSI